MIIIIAYLAIQNPLINFKLLSSILLSLYSLNYSPFFPFWFIQIILPLVLCKIL